MAMSDWTQISNLEERRLQVALDLLKGSFNDPNQYSNLTREHLQRKMRPGAIPNEIPQFCLRVFAHDDVDDPDVSAFFFLRRVMSTWAYCLTVGARDENDPKGGLDEGELRDALLEVCGEMKSLAGGVRLDVMHAGTTPGFKYANLAAVYTNAKGNTLRSDGSRQGVRPWPLVSLNIYWIDI